jgi:hypothetical protein
MGNGETMVNPTINGLVYGKIYREPWFLPSNISNIGFSG